MQRNGYPMDAGEELCPVCGMYRGQTQASDSWAFHLAICYSLAEAPEEDAATPPERPQD